MNYLEQLFDKLEFGSSSRDKVYILTKSFVDRCNDDLINLSEMYLIDSKIKANRIIEKFTKSFLDSVSDPNNYLAPINTISTGQFDNEQAIVKDGLITVSSILFSSARKFIEKTYCKHTIWDISKVKENSIISFIEKNQKEFVSPTRIILLMDSNDTDEIKKWLNKCPDSTKLFFINNYNEDDCIKSVVSSVGSENALEFFEFFGKQGFGTCASTPKEILTPDRDLLLENNAKLLFKFKSNLIDDKKNEIKTDINDSINELSRINQTSQRNLVTMNLECIARSFRMLCYDSGVKDIKECLELAKEINIEIISANALKFSHFIPTDRRSKQQLLMKAAYIFEKNELIDQKIYCINNSLLHEFSLNDHSGISNEFKSIVKEANSDKCTIAGYPHLLNNFAVSYLFEGNYDKATEIFQDALDYIEPFGKTLQYFAVKSNMFISNFMQNELINEEDLLSFVDSIIKTFGLHKVNYLISHYVLNVLAVCIKTNLFLYKQIINQYPEIYELFSLGLQNNMGTGSMIYQMQVLSVKHPDFDLLEKIQKPYKLTEFIGERKNFTDITGFNPFIFNIWL